MVKLANTFNTFSYDSTVENTAYDYSVSGNMFGIVMDATIQKDEIHTQVRMLAPQPHLQGTGGETLPSVGKLY